MPEQRRIGYHWNLRQIMATRNLWKTTELIPLLRSRGINLSTAQVHRLVTSPPERIPARTFAALCDILECGPGDLFEPSSRCVPWQPPMRQSTPPSSGSGPGIRSPNVSAWSETTPTTRMARPRKPGDPVRWPEGCDRCYGHYQVVTVWQSRGICGYCYQAAKRVTGTCACGHEASFPASLMTGPLAEPAPESS